MVGSGFTPGPVPRGLDASKLDQKCQIWRSAPSDGGWEKVREGLASYDDPGWYDHPAGTVSELATHEELRAVGIKV